MHNILFYDKQKNNNSGKIIRSEIASEHFCFHENLFQP